MTTLRIELDDDLIASLESLRQPAPHAARELIVLELYRRGVISSGKAAQVLGMDRIDFIDRASSVGIPYYSMADDDWLAERAASEQL